LIDLTKFLNSWQIYPVLPRSWLDYASQDESTGSCVDQSCGHLAVQLAKWKGAKVIGTGSARNCQFLMDLGVDQFIDYTTEHFEERIKEVDVVLDTIGGETLTKSFSIIKKNGVIVSLVDFDQIKQASTFGVKGMNVIVEPNTEQLTRIGELMAIGKLHAHIAQIFPLNEAREAHRLIDSGHVRGKILFKV
jgi:NADPH:quinone reductase-like Zn-dependent oxidoreductase